MDYKPVPVGVDNFEHLVTRGYYFIDKTWFMKEQKKKKGSVNLFTRPRRFGKTMMANTIASFFGKGVDSRFTSCLTRRPGSADHTVLIYPG